MNGLAVGADPSAILDSVSSALLARSFFFAGFDETGSVSQAGLSMNSKKSAAPPETSGNPRRSSTVPSFSGEPQPTGSLWILWVARALLLIALGIAGYLSFLSFTGGNVAGCGADSGCSEVLASRWSKWLGIPVSLPAAVAYAVMVGLTWGGLHSINSRCSLQVLCLLVFGAAAWFLGLSVFVVGKLCPYCLITHACGTVGSALLLSWLTTPREKPFASGVDRCASADGVPALARSRLPLVVACAVAGLVILIGGQFVFTPKSFRVASMNSSTNPVGLAATILNRPIVAAGTAQLASTGDSATRPTRASNILRSPPAPVATTPAPPSPASIPAASSRAGQRLALHGNAFSLDITELPLLGSATAEKVMVSMFDYTCEHCRRAHPTIVTAQRYFSNRLAVVSLPMPLDAKCNPWLRRTGEHNQNACALARLALAVWRADRALFPEYDDWMMTSLEALNPVRAHARAVDLVGLMVLERSMGDPWIAQTLKTSTSLYRTNWLVANSSSMPMMMIGTNVISGSLRNPNEIFELLDVGLGLKRTP